MANSKGKNDSCAGNMVVVVAFCVVMFLFFLFSLVSVFLVFFFSFSTIVQNLVWCDVS